MLVSLRLPANIYIKSILQARVVADSLIAKLEVETSSKAQEVICHGLAKLVMAGIFKDKLVNALLLFCHSWF